VFTLEEYGNVESLQKFIMYNLHMRG